MSPNAPSLSSQSIETFVWVRMAFVISPPASSSSRSSTPFSSSSVQYTSPRYSIVFSPTFRASASALPGRKRTTHHPTILPAPISAHHHKPSRNGVPLPQTHVTAWSEKAVGIAPGLRRKAPRRRNPVRLASSPEVPPLAVRLPHPTRERLRHVGPATQGCPGWRDSYSAGTASASSSYQTLRCLGKISPQRSIISSIT